MDTFNVPCCLARLELSDQLDTESWPPELAKTVQRLVQEGLTNARKHARSATLVRVIIEPGEGRVVVRVRDNATHRSSGRFKPSGFGVIGLTERVTELGGELTSGAQPEGGWELAASLPAN